MTEDELIAQRIRMEKLIDDLLKRMPFLKEEAKGDPFSCSIGKVSWMDSQNNKGISEQLLRESKQKLEKLHNALTRIEKGTYGLCIRCGNPIPVGRLQVIPEVLLCVPCAEKKNR